MSTVQHEDKSSAWLKWRKTGLGASDAAAIMGASPWLTRYMLYLDKTSEEIAEHEKSYITERGNFIEGFIRARIEIIFGMSLPARLCEHHTLKFMLASLDGLNEENMIGMESKLVGKEDYETVCRGEVPKKYIWQLRHQFFVTGVRKIIFAVMYMPKNEETGKYETNPAKGLLKYVVVELEKELPEIERYVKAASDFWLNHVVAMIPPEMCDLDVHNHFSDIDDLAAREYVAAKTAADLAAEKLNNAKNNLLKLTEGHAKSLFKNGLTVNRGKKITINLPK